MPTPTDFDEHIERMVATAAEYGYTREQVLGWRRPAGQPSRPVT